MDISLWYFSFVGMAILRSEVIAVTVEKSGLLRNASVTQENVNIQTCKIDNKNPYLGNPLEPECCNQTYEHYQKYWVLHSIHFVEFVEKLKEGGCPQLEILCKERVFDFTRYSSLVYDRTCNRSAFEDRCLPVVQATVGPNYVSWNSSMAALRKTNLTLKSLEDECIQVALFDAASLAKTKPFGYFHEIKRLFLPFCEFVWCGVDAENINRLDVSAWLCIPSWCKTSLIVITVFCGILAAVILFANGLVIVTFLNNHKLRNSQGIYKLSLAIADLLVGAVVIPTFASSLFKITSYREYMGQPYYDVPRNANVVRFENFTRYDSIPHYPGGGAANHFELWYLNFVGFITTFSLSVSIYTLAIAGIDRLAVVNYPLKYTRDKAKKWAKRACFVIWILAIVCSCVPIFEKTLRYDLVASVLITPTGVTALYLYIVGFALPLLLLWSISIATLIITLKHGKQRKKLQGQLSRQAGKRASTEVRLAKTLIIMVGVFTLSMVPVLVAIITPFFSTSISFIRPQLLNAQSASAFNTFEFITVVILSCNSLWNIFIYNSRNKDFRNAAVGTLRKFKILCGSRVRWFIQRSSRSLASVTSATKSTNLPSVSKDRSVADSRL
uniref:Uncharacterized protein LOC100177887 n=1 Tax=Phallusia mammillata TaxID=59560 RepID=A0A6F9DHA1_9ASCI|nr:uncharacterized protein LOC100177887 [Phallusia mammillata]